MTETSSGALRELLLEGYDELKTRLTQRLGSSDLAGEAIQDTWVRLHNANISSSIRNPVNYLFRIALNIARDRLAADRRLLSTIDIDKLLNLAHDAPGPEQIVEARSHLRALEAIMAELPPRQREILAAAQLDGMPRREIARRLGISLSLVEKELKQAHEYCLRRLSK